MHIRHAQPILTQIYIYDCTYILKVYSSEANYRVSSISKQCVRCDDIR